MKAMVFAAGFGSRLGAVTKTMPKCLVEVGEKPLIMHTVAKLQQAGVSEIVVNLHHLGNVVEEYLTKHCPAGMSFRFSREETLLGTGGGLFNARALLPSDEPFFVHNSDIISEIDLAALWKAHTASDAVATLAVQNRHTSRPLIFSVEGHLMGWEQSEESRGETFGSVVEGERLAFTGVQVVAPRIFSYFEGMNPPYSTISGYMRAARAGDFVQSHRVDSAFWIDAGTPSDLTEARRRHAPSNAMH